MSKLHRLLNMASVVKSADPANNVAYSSMLVRKRVETSPVPLRHVLRKLTRDVEKQRFGPASEL